MTTNDPHRWTMVKGKRNDDRDSKPLSFREHQIALRQERVDSVARVPTALKVLQTYHALREAETRAPARELLDRLDDVELAWIVCEPIDWSRDERRHMRRYYGAAAWDEMESWIRNAISQ